MAPIKFMTSEGVWVGVGDKVWTVAGKPRQGMVTGFTRSEDGEMVIQVQVTHLTGTGREARQEIGEYPFEQVWAIEKNAWMLYIGELTDERSGLAQRITRLDDEIRALWSQWTKS